MWTDAVRDRGRIRRAVGRLAAGLLLATGAPVPALTTDRDQPIAIQADRAEHDDVKRVTTYSGAVVIDQGSLRITGDTVTIEFGEGDAVSKMTAVGAPVHFRQSSDGGGNRREAWARRIEYFPDRDLIVLLGEARYEKDGNRVQADRLVYDSLNARFKAMTDPAGAAAVATDDGTGQEKPERVRISITPKKKPTE